MTGTPAQAKARELGIPVVTPREAQRIMDDAIRTTDHAAFERRQEHAHWEAERAEADRYWQHTWKRAEDPAAASSPAGCERR